MSNKTITKIFAFVIFLAAVGMTFSGCPRSLKNDGPTNIGNDGKSDEYKTPAVAGTIGSAEINESSGIAASKCQAGVLWTHNDSGDAAFIYAIDERGGSLGTWRVSAAENLDWEDIAAFKDEKGACFLYLGEIGNNKRERTEMRVYRVREPIVADADRISSRSNPMSTEPAETIRFNYPDGPHDAEAILVHPQTGEIYVVTKSRKETAGVFKVRTDPRSIVTAEKIAEVSLPSIPDGLVTGGDISPDGRRVILCDYFGGYELILPDNANRFDEVWKIKALTINLGEREIGESVGYSADGRAIFATSEKIGQSLMRVDRK